MHKLLQRLVWIILRSLMFTWRIEKIGMENRQKARALSPTTGVLFACWHEQMVSFLTCHAWTEPYLAMASRSKDGDFAAYIATKMGFVPVRGSSRRKKHVSKGGAEALKEYITKLSKGMSGGITVDGPKGPRRKVKPGIVQIARKTGAPVIPAVGLASSFWVFDKAWDKFKIPKPFARLVLIYDEPLMVPADASEEKIAEICAHIESRINILEEQFHF